MGSLKWVGSMMLCGVMAGTVVAEDNREVLTPKPGPEPRINGAKVFGVP